MKYSKYNIITENEGFVLYNSVTKASIKINHQIKEKIEKNIIDGYNQQEMELLTKNGFLIENDRDELKELQLSVLF